MHAAHTHLQAYLNVAFDNAELRALNAANIDCDITFMQVCLFVLLDLGFGPVYTHISSPTFPPPPRSLSFSVPRVPCYRGRQDGKIR